MSSLRLKQRALALAQPLSAHLELTYRCPWRCCFCYNPRRSDRSPLTRAEWSAVLDELRLLGTLTVTLTGGEPLARPDFFEIAEAARARAFAFVLFTNGALLDDAAADRLARLDPLAVEMPLHGASAATHDHATGTPGSFHALQAAIARLLDRKLRLRLKTPVTTRNVGEIEAMADLVARLGVPYRLDPTISARQGQRGASSRHALAATGLEATYRLIAGRGQLPRAERVAGGFNCGLGLSTLAVDPEGEVYPCLQWREQSLGNVRRQRLSRLWHSSPARAAAAAVARSANQRLLGEASPLAGFPYCPAVALQRTGDALKPDDMQQMQARIVERIRRADTAACTRP
jgi:mycofactocin biosynthetic radical S-adenosylmethionine protein MftC